MLLKNISILLFFSIIISCKWDKKFDDSSSPNKNSIVIIQDSISKQGPMFVTDKDTAYSHVLIKFPKSLGLGGADASIINTLKALQFDGFVSELFIEENQPKPTDLSSAIDYFLKTSEPDPKDKDAMFMPYEFQSIIDTSFVGSEVISMVMSQYTFTGGAHPNSYVSYYNFERSTGKIIDVESLIQDTIAMKKVVQAAFEKNEKTVLGEDYDVKNYFFEDGFFLPQNYSITGKGLYCFYNPYEAAAYVRGPIEFTIPWRDLNGIITKFVPLDGVKLGDDLQ